MLITPPATPHDFQPDLDAVAAIPAIGTILEVICRTTGLRFAAVARVTEDRWVCCAAKDDLAVTFAAKNVDAGAARGLPRGEPPVEQRNVRVSEEREQPRSVAFFAPATGAAPVDQGRPTAINPEGCDRLCQRARVGLQPPSGCTLAGKCPPRIHLRAREVALSERSRVARVKNRRTSLKNRRGPANIDDANGHSDRWHTRASPVKTW